MALKKKTITITNKDTDVLFIDEEKVDTAKNAIKKDLKNIIADLNNIEKNYKRLLNDKNTKGQFKKMATTCVSKSNKFEKKMNNDKTTIESAIDRTVLQYAIALIKELKATQAAADSIDAG